jgi:hypothetical protein
MSAAASILEREKDRFANIITLEMGKPLAASLEEVEKCAAGCRYFAEHAERFLADEHLEGGGLEAPVRLVALDSPGPIDVAWASSAAYTTANRRRPILDVSVRQRELYLPYGGWRELSGSRHNPDRAQRHYPLR